MFKKLNTWGLWWFCLLVVLFSFLISWVQIQEEKEREFYRWADAQWEIQPNFTIATCDGFRLHCSEEKNWVFRTFFYFPDSRYCKGQTEDGECSGNFEYRPGEFEEMHNFFRGTGWVQPEHWPPWRRESPRYRP